MQRRTFVQVFSATLSALFAGVGRASAPVAQAVLPARVVKKVWGPYVDILPKPINTSEGMIVARMVNPARRGGRPGADILASGPRVDPMHHLHYTQILAKDYTPPSA